MDAWLTRARNALAAESGLDPSALDLDGEAERELLELARLAAHESGDRRNAPLLCYLAGAAGRSGSELGRLVQAVRRSTS